ncbi:MAG: TetR/AcrR family transcriptional regulator C-terminal domain-containing protein [Chloroflexi bacterium]|nr:TetR/AcrR family transcriptional regulator C-terminal domain-containing protein [Chloroflexota bacterium]
MTQPQALQLRPLMIGESGRFPELARTCYDHVPRAGDRRLRQPPGLADPGRAHGPGHVHQRQLAPSEVLDRHPD